MANKSEDTRECVWEKFEVKEVLREQLQNAPYNPRMIDDKARRKLKANLKRVGLLEPLVWNKRTGNLVSGHQRVSILDQLEKDHNYKLHVSVVDLDEQTEKEQNLFFNNPLDQGDFDSEKLASVFADLPDIQNTGFDLSDMAVCLGDDTALGGEELGKLSNEMHAAIDRYESVCTSSDDRDNPHFFLVVIFKNHEERQNFTDNLDLDDQRYVDGRDLLSLLQPQKDATDRE